jgi:hypothetical protein
LIYQGIVSWVFQNQHEDKPKVLINSVIVNNAAPSKESTVPGVAVYASNRGKSGPQALSRIASSPHLLHHRQLADVNFTRNFFALTSS